jgi:hypothetical protein
MLTQLADVKSKLLSDEGLKILWIKKLPSHLYSAVTVSGFLSSNIGLNFFVPLGLVVAI